LIQVNGLVWLGSDNTEMRGSGLALSAAFLALCAASAHSGFAATERCSQVRALNAMCITGDEDACRTLRPGWTPPMRLPPQYQSLPPVLQPSPRPTPPAPAPPPPASQTEAAPQPPAAPAQVPTAPPAP
jgi:hypothetical protein